MGTRWQRPLAALVVAVALAIVALALPHSSAQAQSRQTTPAYSGPRTSDGKPNLNGIWQVLSTAHWDLEAHSAQEGIPAGQSVVEGGDIPYQPSALAKRKENYQKRATADPLSKCYLPGVPRVTYIPLPFEIVQTPKYVLISYEIAHARRIIYTDGSPHVEALEFWMGDSRGRWEKDTLVVDTNNLTDKTWLDKAGNFHSADLHVIERYTPVGTDHISYEVTMEDPKVYTRPWKMNLMIYRRLEKDLQLFDYDCVSFFWQKLSGQRQTGGQR